ncbi:orotidine-5'-phosphate decarboxylase [[Clostridium] colinum]|uniref:orotidine-5'-phosphate decarboxylase n=1 Tax=[Clostridium] colinum TaxID=36835 RepID=UPI0020250F0A|nr:orotidine-5'-phosphate decarboxylase [[Clostridium] colinum]
MVIDRLIDKINQTGNPTVVGLDPRLDYIPSFIIERKYEKFGHSLKAVAEAMYDFNKYIIDEIYDLVPAVKPQIAMYERYGIEGLNTYLKTIEHAKEKGLIIIGDIKRSDIASTAEAYSDGHIGRTVVKENSFDVFKQDFITLNPYLGSDSITPFLEDCKKYEKGLFILAKTSNPNSGEIQDLIVDGKPLYEKIGYLIDKWGSELIGKNGYSEVGAVVGATHKEQAKRLRQIMPKSFFLVPGYGAQGGKAEDLAVCFDKNGIGAIINSSRGIIANHLKEEFKTLKGKDFAKASRQAVIEMKEDLRRYI